MDTRVITGLLVLCLCRMELTSAEVDVCSKTYSLSGALCSCTPAYDCRFKSLKDVPSGFTNVSATTMILLRNKIVSLHKGSFNHLRHIETMNIAQNYISSIETGTFDGLMKLRILYLNDNRLGSIGPGIFRHLPGLTEIDLSSNPITTLDRHAFFTLPSLNKIALNNINLNCTCETRLLRAYFDVAFAVTKLDVQGAPCQNLNQVKLMLVPLVNFPPCPPEETLFEPATSCYSCTGASGTRDCATKGQETPCTQNNAVCYTRILYPTTHLEVSGGCIDYQTCQTNEQQNYRICTEATPATPTTCYFCTREKLSNNKEVTGTTKEFKLLVLIRLNTALTSGLANSASNEYNNFVQSAIADIQTYLSDQKSGSFTMHFVDLRPPDVTVTVLIPTETIWYISKQKVIDTIKNRLPSNGTINGKSIVSIDIVELGQGAQCYVETQVDQRRGTFEWPTTEADMTVSISCPYQLSTGKTRSASRYCQLQPDGSAQWMDASIGDCPYADANSQYLENIANTQINDDNVESIASNLSSLSNDWETFDSNHVTWTTDTITGIVGTGLSSTSRDVIGNTVETVDNMLYIEQDIITQSQEESTASNKLIEAVETLLANTDVNRKEFVTIKNNIAGIVSKVDSVTFNGMKMSYVGRGQPLHSTQMMYSQTVGRLAQGQSGIILPQTILTSLSTTEKNNVKKVTLSVYKDAKLFEAISKPSPVTQTDVTSDDDRKSLTRKINSNVISASVPNNVIGNLNEPVKITFHHKNEGENATCVYWNPIISDWRTDGCVMNVSTNGFSECHCNHLTNFALLMDVYDTGKELDDGNKLALSIISYVGCGISFVCVCLTLLTYIKFRKLRRDNPSKILLNLCVAIGFVDIIFLLGMQTYTATSLGACKAVAAMLHYFLLAAFCWMAVEAFYMYLALVKIFDTYIARFQLKSALFGWGIPLVIVVVTLCVNTTDNYGIQAAQLCWLERIPFYIAFLAPVCLVLVLNTISYILVIIRIMGRSSSKLTKSDKSNTTVRLRGAVSLLVLLGLTWMFAFFAIGDAAVVFHYLFALLNTLQGVFIFIFYCCLKKEAQQCWRKSLPCFKSPYEQSSSRNTDSKEREPLHKEMDTSTFDSNKTAKSTVPESKRDSGEKPKPKYEVDTSSSTELPRWRIKDTTTLYVPIKE